MSEAPDILAGRYRIIRRLGAGAMATVYLAEDLQLESTQVACKVLHQHLRRTTSVAKRFAYEVIAARRVRHETIVEIFDLISTDDTLLITMEYVPGQDLRYRIGRDGPFPPDEAARMGALLCEGLAHAHAAGVVHGDVKPHNVLVDDTGTLKLVDFGMARVGAIAGASAHSVTFGTPEYVAPEQLTDRFVDARADLYALGATLFEMLTGRPPFLAATPYALIRKKAESTAPSVRDLVPSVPESLDLAIQRALAPNPEDRFQSAEDFGAALAPDASPGGAVAIADRNQACPSCGASMLTELPFCFSCGNHAGPYRRDPEHRHLVMVLRKPWWRAAMYADPLSYDDKYRVVEHARSIAQAAVKNPRRMDQRLKTPPFIVADHLPPDEAKRLADDLASRDLRAVMMQDGLRARLRFLLNEPTAAPAILLVPTCLAFLATTLVILGEASLIGRAMLFFAPIALLIAYWERLRMRPLPELIVADAEAGDDQTPDIGWLLTPARRLHQTAKSHGLVRTVARLLARVVRVHDALATADTRSARGHLSATLQSAEALCAAIQQADDFLAQTDERVICETMEHLDRQIAEAVDIASTEPLTELRLAQAELLAARAQVEGNRSVAYTRLLSISTRLDRIHASLASSSAADASAHGDEALEALEAQTAAWVALEGDEPG